MTVAPSVDQNMQILADWALRRQQEKEKSMIKLGIRLELSKDQFETLQRLSSRLGFRRENPRGRWTDLEYKEAARYAVTKLIDAAINQNIAERQKLFGPLPTATSDHDEEAQKLWDSFKEKNL